MPDDTNQKLEQLRTKILDDLAGMSDQLVSNDTIGFETLLAIARSTGKIVLLEKALQRAETIENASDKAGALLDVLDEVDFQLNLAETPERDDTSQPDTAHESQPEQPDDRE